LDYNSFIATNKPKETKMQHFPITNSKVIGKHPDGTLARMWTEGNRVFIEGYGYSIPAASGTRYGAIMVREITPTNATPTNE
jgi:hypothetical protein